MRLVFLGGNDAAACAEERIFGEDQFDKPTKITVEAALKSIAAGYKEMREVLGDKKIGLFPCKAIVTMNIPAGGDAKDSLVLNAAAKPAPGWEKLLVTGEVSAKADFTTALLASRNNAITFEMYNVACLPTGTLGFDKPDKMGPAFDLTNLTTIQRVLPAEEAKRLFPNLDFEELKRSGLKLQVVPE